MDSTHVKTLAMDQCARYPGLQLQDVVKALYQAEFGCGHFVQPGPQGLRYLMQELTEVQADPRDMSRLLIEPLGPSFCRVHLQGLQHNALAPETLFRLFCLSSREKGEMPRFLAHLEALEACLPELPIEADNAWLAQYRDAGCPATRHSAWFREHYAPAYRVVSTRYARLIPLLEKLDALLAGQERVLLAIEGGSASGKSTLAAILQEIYPDSAVFHMDDFFLQPHQRTPERFAQPGGNVDHERFLAEVLTPLRYGQTPVYRPFDCSVMALADPVQVTPGRLCIIEGAYSMHPDLRDGYDLSVCLMADAETQRSRIIARNGKRLWQRFESEWIPLEQRYFAACGVPECCSLTLTL